LTPEARARQSIDALLDVTGLAVKDLTQYRIFAEGNRYPAIFHEVVADLNVILQLALPHPLATLSKAVSVSAQ
jgi:hypothetical protein